MPRRRDERARVLGPYYIKTTGYWRIVSVDPRAAGGKGARAVDHFRSLEEAEIYKEVSEARLAASSTRTIGEAIDAFEKHLMLNIAEKSAKERGWRLRQFFKGALDLQLARLKHDRAEAIYEVFRQGHSVDTHRNFLGNAKGLMLWCVKRRWIESSPLLGVEGVGPRRKGKPQLTGDEARRFYATALELAGGKGKGAKGALGAAMLLTMGLRNSEVFLRRVRDLDLDGTVLRIEHAKTNAGNRLVAVPEALQPRLLELAKGRPGFAPLFVRKRKGGVETGHTKTWLLAAVKRVCSAAGVPMVCPHGLRGTHATMALHLGLGAQVVADSLGHESSATTLRHYAAPGSAEAGAQQKALQVLEGAEP